MKSSLVLLTSLFLLNPAAIAAPLNHPTLFFDAADVPRMRERSESTRWLRAERDKVIRRADAFMSTPTDPAAFVAENIGDRHPRRFIGRLAKARIETLAEAGYLTGDERYLLKSREILLAVVRKFDPLDREVWAQHLQYSGATHTLAIGYDLLYPYLTPAERSEVREEIREYGHLLYTDDSTWGVSADGVTSCNHNAIHFAALGLAALVLGDEPEWLARAIERVTGYYNLFADATGYVTEGHSYLGYGQAAAVPFSVALQRVTGVDLFQAHPVLRKINDQFTWMLLPFDGHFRTLNDSQDLVGSPATLYHSLVANDGAQIGAWLQASERQGGVTGHMDGLEEFGYLLLLLAGAQPLEPQAPGEAGWPLGKHYSSGRVILRSAWDNPDAAHVVLTSGYDMHQGHNQQDENSVSFAALGEDFLTDPGYWPDASDCHTTLKINGVEQALGSRGKVLAYREDRHGAMVRAQAQEAYPIVPSFVGLAERKIYFVRGPNPYLVWRDDTGIEIGTSAEVVARYVTHKGNGISERGDAVVIHGANGRASCLLRVYSEDQSIAVKEDNLAGQTFIANGEERVAYAEHMKRLSAKVDKYRARLLTIVIPFRDDSALPTPEVTYDRDADTLTCRLAFPQGDTDTLVFGATDIRFQRSARYEKQKNQ